MILITGSSGFVGKELCRELLRRQIPFKAGVRKPSKIYNEIVYGDLNAQIDWQSYLEGVDIVIHLAARVHVMKEESLNPIEAFRQVNVDMTLNLARAAKLSKVRRFIFLSSVKVNGEMTFDLPFSPLDQPAPLDAYGISKWEAEKGLMKMHCPGEFEVVIIRPPLIYGPGVKANFKKLFDLVKKGFPLPFGLVNNKRSLVSVYNLIDLIILCSTHRNAPGKMLLVSDDHDLSLRELILKISRLEDKPIWLLPVPVMLMKGAALLLNKKNYADRLFGNLQIDISETKKLLEWSPPKTFEETFQAH